MIETVVVLVCKLTLLFMAGWSSVVFCLTFVRPERREKVQTQLGYTFLSVPASFIFLLALSTLLWWLNCYSQMSITAGMLLYVAIMMSVIFLRFDSKKEWQAFVYNLLLQPFRQQRGTGTIIFISAFTVTLLCHSLLDLIYRPAAIAYFIMGYPLAEHAADPLLFTSYGISYHVPILFLKYVLLFLTAFFAEGDRLVYLTIGIPLLASLTTALVVTGAYNFFKYFFVGRFTALVLSGIFLLTILSGKLVSVRAETIGWIPGFGFLILFVFLLQTVRDNSLTVKTCILSSIVGFMFAATVLTHGVVTTVVALFACGLAIHDVFAGGLSMLRRLLVCAVPVVGSVLFVAVLLYGVFAARQETGQLFQLYDEPPVAGSLDPADLYHYFLMQDHEYPENRVLVRPPYKNLLENLQIVLVIPWQKQWLPWLKQFNFNIQSIVNWFSPLLLAFSGLSIIGVLTGANGLVRSRPLLFGALTVFAGVFFFSIKLNYSSVYRFPWQVIENRFIVIQVAMALLLVLSPLLTVLESFIRSLRYTFYQYGRALVLERFYILLFFLSFLFVISDRMQALIYLVLFLLCFIFIYGFLDMDGMMDNKQEELDRRPLESWPFRWKFLSTGLVSLMTVAIVFSTPQVSRGVFSKNNRRGHSPYVQQEFTELVQYLRKRVQKNDRAVANFTTIRYMHYLTGVEFLTEGESMLQIYGLIKKSAESLAELKSFSLNPTIGFLNNKRVRYVVISKKNNIHFNSPGRRTFPLLDREVMERLNRSEEKIQRVYENAAYLVYERHVSQPPEGLSKDFSSVKPLEAAIN